MICIHLLVVHAHEKVQRRCTSSAVATSCSICRHQTVRSGSMRPLLIKGSPSLQIWILKEGWLSKRSSGRMTHRVWQRRWFVLQSDGTLYHLSSRNGEDRKAVVNLCISTIKHELKDRDRLTFSLVSPHLTYALQAESAAERQEWIDSIQVCSRYGFFPPSATDVSKSPITHSISLYLMYRSFHSASVCDHEWTSLQCSLSAFLHPN